MTRGRVRLSGRREGLGHAMERREIAPMAPAPRARSAIPIRLERAHGACPRPVG